MNTVEFFGRLRSANKIPWLKTVEFVLHTFGTALACNRFAIGEIIENATRDLLVSCGIEAVSVPSAKRYDLKLLNVSEIPYISCKFVSDDKSVILHNSNRKQNTDIEMIPTLLFTPKEWWYLSPKTVADYEVDLAPYLKNNGDSLQLDLKLLIPLREKEYPYYLEQPLVYEKVACLRKPTSDLTYRLVRDFHDPTTDPTLQKYIQDLLDSLETVPIDEEILAAREKKETEKAAKAAAKAEAKAAAKAAKDAAKAEAKAVKDAAKAEKAAKTTTKTMEAKKSTK